MSVRLFQKTLLILSLVGACTPVHRGYKMQEEDVQTTGITSKKFNDIDVEKFVSYKTEIKES